MQAATDSFLRHGAVDVERSLSSFAEEYALGMVSAHVLLQHVLLQLIEKLITVSYVSFISTNSIGVMSAIVAK